MKAKHLKRAARAAAALTGALEARLPDGCAIPSEDVFAAVWPLACQLERLRRKARKGKKNARRYRRLRAQVAEVLRTKPDTPVPIEALARSVPLDARLWRAVLLPGIAADALEAA